jgi:RpiR family glv operon transcriptional regulator
MKMTNLESIVSRHFTNFTESDQQIYEFLVKNSSKVQAMTINDLAKLSFTSKSSVLRFTQKLGFKGFSDFKYSIDWFSTQLPEKNLHHPLSTEMIVIENTLSEEKVMALNHLIKNTTLICLASTGEDQTLQMKNFARFLLKKGIMSTQLKLNPSSEITKLVLDKMTKDQLLIVFSSSGNSQFTKQYLTPILNKKVPVVAIIAFSNSWLEEVAQITFSLHVSARNDQLVPYTSGLSHLLINILVERLKVK